jgi:hypothetical protein
LAYIFVRVEEDRVTWTGLTAELVDEGFRLFEQGIGTTPRGSFFFLARLLGDGNPIPGASCHTPKSTADSVATSVDRTSAAAPGKDLLSVSMSPYCVSGRPGKGVLG